MEGQAGCPVKIVKVCVSWPGHSQSQILKKSIVLKKGISPSTSLFLLILSSSVHIIYLRAECADHLLCFVRAPAFPPAELNLSETLKIEYVRVCWCLGVCVGHTSVRSSGRWNVSLISSGVFPSIIRASARLVRSTKGFNWRLSAADVNSHSFFVSMRMNFSSNVLRSYAKNNPCSFVKWLLSCP